ncbi:class I tRNA ligase family protein [Mycoplasmopsis gallinarum]|uniref:Cysteinyl-tRNA synthetase n=1 Tax=Mycoplasmopsis gallinarum TaxID=29557 RepID=A0A168R9V7_9BACT|nr:class I tRNA ligase family protein [Mycoplasmopsis gallinarum]OAB48765.1 Cysteinyl-tRNA synthetase [Mycoplasmopsis gallinarum]
MKSRNNLNIYVCGPTVYNYVHIGNLRPILTYDLMLKGWRELGNSFNFVHNLTDIDDKIIKKAIEENKTEKEISEFYTKDYLKLLSDLNVNTITSIEKVTNNIEFIADYVQKLLEKNNAYKDNQNNIWFNIEKNQNHYGVVSNQKLINMNFEENDSNKLFEADFALWKNTTIGIKYQTKIGYGRPGWHTECCALISKHFGSEGVDIHGGGMDLTFPHHENENIQHFALYNENIANEWIRTGQINLDGLKMSKSLGNIILANDFIEKYGPEILKLIILNSKISAPINITDSLIDNMQAILSKYKKFVFKFFILNIDTQSENLIKFKENEIFLKAMESLSKFDFADFNLILNSLIKDFNKNTNYETASIIFKILSIIHPKLTDKSQYKKSLEIYEQWQKCLKERDFLNADKLRKQLIDEKLI